MFCACECLSIVGPVEAPAETCSPCDSPVPVVPSPVGMLPVPKQPASATTTSVATAIFCPKLNCNRFIGRMVFKNGLGNHLILLLLHRSRQPLADDHAKSYAVFLHGRGPSHADRCRADG